MNSRYEHIRRKLMAEKKDLEGRAKEKNNFHLEQSMRDSDGELSLHDNHPADAATTMYEREKDISLLEHDRHRLEDIEQALQRMEVGSYGVCQQCGKNISLERLEAVPTTLYCIDHQQTTEGSSDRPVEEEVLTGFEQFNFDDKDDETEFDAEDSWQAVARFNELPNVFDEDYYDSEEARGYVEPIEGFIITDADGNVINETAEFSRNHLYEDYMHQGEGYGVIWEDEILTPEKDKSE